MFCDNAIMYHATVLISIPHKVHDIQGIVGPSTYMLVTDRQKDRQMTMTISNYIGAALFRLGEVK